MPNNARLQTIAILLKDGSCSVQRTADQDYICAHAACSTSSLFLPESHVNKHLFYLSLQRLVKSKCSTSKANEQNSNFEYLLLASSFRACCSILRCLKDDGNHTENIYGQDRARHAAHIIRHTKVGSGQWHECPSSVQVLALEMG